MIAIHTKSGKFVHGWIEYCRENAIEYREVDCYASDITRQLEGCSALMWHWAHHDFRARLFARQLTAAIEKSGIAVFPNTATCWHYDDKVGQKYLLEAIGAPLVPTHVFYDRDIALEWAGQTSFPKVWKLRGGAGSQNVKLVRSREDARKVISRSFGKGWSNSRFHALKDRIWAFRRDRDLKSFLNISRGIARAIIPHENNTKSQLQRDYVYFQDFIPENDCDIRVNIIGNRGFAVKRMVRHGDFRASGSNFLRHARQELPEDCIRIAFETAAKLNTQSCAFDFIQHNGEWLIVEISYAFPLRIYQDCPGYWDKSLNWHEGPVRPDYFMIEDLLAAVGRKGIS